jgi:phospholipid/cholesterol/gamma-HCH transport system substrate-binding protein
VTVGSAVRRFGVFLVASLFLTWWIAGQITGRSGGGYELQARFDDVAGLVEGNDVRLAGVPVGRVTGISVEDGDAVVRLEVDDTAVAVRWRNLIGQRYLSLRPGDAHELLGGGDDITETDDVVDLGRIVNQLSPLAQAVGPEQVNRILTALVTAFEGNDGAFDALATDLGSLAGALADRSELLGQMQADYATITEAIASRDEQIAAMVSNLAALTGTLDATDRLVEAAVGEAGRFARGAEAVLARTTDDLGAVLDQLPVVTGTAVESLDKIETAIRTFSPMMDAVLPTLNRGPYLRVSLLCLAAGPGPCPHPLLFFEDEDS